MKIGIIGLGLIGGSIYKDLTNLGYDIIAVSQSQTGPNIFKEISSIKDCSIIFICTPMNKTLSILGELENIVKSDTIVTDVCSLKEFVCKKNRPYKFIPSHPMAGTEKQGFENSLTNLFQGAKWVLTPFDTLDKNNNKLVMLIKELGATPVITTPREHDRAVAIISHMPMLISQAIFKTAKPNKLAMDIASSGFKDMTRLAMSNTEMATDMITINSDNIENSLLELYQNIGDLLHNNYKNQIEHIRNERSKMYK